MKSNAVFIFASLLTLCSQAALASTKGCSLGLAGSCLINSATNNSKNSEWRYEAFTGYKPGMSYFEREQENCKGNCSIDVTGPAFGIDIYKNISGHNRSSEFMDVGLQYMSIPIANWQSEEPFEGTNKMEIGAGSGKLRYHFVRFNIKRGNFLNLISSKYLVSSFGVGLAIPETSGTGSDLVGATSVHPSIGGKLGFQYPVTENIELGVVSGWSVLWYGASMADSAFISSYGINLSWRV